MPVDHSFEYLTETQRPKALFVLESFARRVVAQNGREEPARCQPQRLPPIYVEGETITQETCGCGGQTQFRVPYDREDELPGSILACAICDGGLVWPRFREAPDAEAA